MNPFVILVGGGGGGAEIVLVDPTSSSWGKTWAPDDHVIPM